MARRTVRRRRHDEFVGVADGGGEPHKLTDFASRAVVIARRVTWSPDGKSIYAAVADVDTDIVLLTGLLR